MRPERTQVTMNDTKTPSLFFQLSWKIVAFCLLLFGVGCIFADPLSWGKGVLFGGLFTILRLKMMEMAVNKAVSKPSGKASGYMSAQYFIRYLMSAAVLIVAALEPSIDVLATALAMLSLKVATYVQTLLDKRTPKDGSVEFNEWVDEEDETVEQWDRWQTYNLKARRKEKKRRKPDSGPLPAEAGAQDQGQDEGQQISFFDEEYQEMLSGAEKSKPQGDEEVRSR